MTIAAHTLVCLKHDHTRAGVLLEGEKHVAGARMVRVRFGDGVKWLPESKLEPVSSTSESLSDGFAAGRFVEPDWLRRVLTRLRVTGRLNEVVYSMNATETDFYAYQFKPVIKLMNSPTDALLIADEVGLGKTIEAGLVWTELRARLHCDRLLVVCPKTLCQKWQDELVNRFGVDAEIGDARSLLRTLRRSRETKRGFALICSMQGLRRPRRSEGDDTVGQGGRRSPRRDLTRFLDEEADGDPLIDLLVVDEAHHMRNPATLLAEFGQLANSVASHRLFLSATPIHLRNRDLQSLLVMVDPDTFELESTLEELIATNAPIIRARDQLLRADTSVQEVAERLEEARSHDVLRHSRGLAQIREQLGRANLDRSKRSELAARLEQVNQLANYVTRTRRRDVQEFRVTRDPKAPVLRMSAKESLFYEEISAVVRDYAWDRDANEYFLLSMPQRLLTSSLAAASSYWFGIEGTAADDEVEETDQGLSDDYRNGDSDKHPLRTRIAKRTRDLNMTAALTEVDTKYRLLLRELRHLWEGKPNAKVIVFSSFKPTLHYLRQRLDREGVPTELLHGSVTRERAEILRRFERQVDIRVLLSSEVGSEGVDLQFSSIIVNYDLPWNPMRLEQRIGRVDRLGQESDKVTILNLIYDETIDKRIYERLYERLKIGRRALGELEAVLGKPIRELTMRLLDPKLTDEQREQAIDQTAQALENRRREEERLESEAGSLVQHGDYILERIMESRERHRWLSADDILGYVRDGLLQAYPSSVIETNPAGSDTYRIKLSTEAMAAFQTFLARRGLKGRTRLLRGDARQRFRFTPSIVQRDDRVEYISQLHPLVRFVAAYDSDSEAQAVAATVGMSWLPAAARPGLYVLAARRWSSGGATTGAMGSTRIGYSGARVTTGQLIDADLAERMMAVTAEHGRTMLNPGMHGLLNDACRTLRQVVERELDSRYGEFVDHASAEIADRVTIRRRSLARHFEKKIATLEEQQRNLNDRARHARLDGDIRRATNLKNLATARETQIDRLRTTRQLREHQIEGELDLTPEESDVGAVLLQVHQ